MSAACASSRRRISASSSRVRSATRRDHLLGDGGLGGKLATVLAASEDLLALAHAARGDAGLGEAADVTVVCRAEALGDQNVERLADDLVLGVAEYCRGAFVEDNDPHVLVERDDGIRRDRQDGRHLRLGEPQLGLGIGRRTICELHRRGLIGTRWLLSRWVPQTKVGSLTGCRTDPLRHYFPCDRPALAKGPAVAY
jgi:hypothetical protein